jgi:hypothetical protein
MLQLHHLLISGHPVPELLIKSYYKGKLYMPSRTTSLHPSDNALRIKYNRAALNKNTAPALQA